MNQEVIRFIAKKLNRCDGTVEDEYVGDYEKVVCWGEVIRNICVNLNIDPDTHDGVTINIHINIVDLESGSKLPFKYHPGRSIGTKFGDSACHKQPIILLEITERNV